jgi:hypothetical protein
MHNRERDLGSQSDVWRIAVLNGEQLHPQKHADQLSNLVVDVLVARAYGVVMETMCVVVRHQMRRTPQHHKYPD